MEARALLKRYPHVVALVIALPLLTGLYFALAQKQPPGEVEGVSPAPQPVAEPPPADVAPGLTGRWLVTATETDGEAVPRAHWDHLAWAFRGKTAVVTSRGAGVGLPDRDMEFRYEVDAGQQPSHLTLRATDPRFGFTGIYKLEGDTLTICWSAGGQSTRPRDFKTRPNDGFTLTTFRRAP